MYPLPPSTFRYPVATCCGLLEAAYRNKELSDLPELKKRVNYLGSVSQRCLYYRCALCGQVWEDHWVDVMHASTHYLLKSELHPDGKLTWHEIDPYRGDPDTIAACGKIGDIGGIEFTSPIPSGS